MRESHTNPAAGGACSSNEQNRSPFAFNHDNKFERPKPGNVAIACPQSRLSSLRGDGLLKRLASMRVRERHASAVCLDPGPATLGRRLPKSHADGGDPHGGVVQEEGHDRRRVEHLMEPEAARPGVGPPARTGQRDTMSHDHVAWDTVRHLMLSGMGDGIPRQMGCHAGYDASQLRDIMSPGIPERRAARPGRGWGRGACARTRRHRACIQPRRLQRATWPHRPSRRASHWRRGLRSIRGRCTTTC